MSEHSAHLTSLPFGFRTWLWRYTCLLLLISMLWHRQAIFESKGDKLSSSAESRIRTWEVSRHLITWLWRYTYLLLLISMLWHRQAIFESKGDKLSSSAEGRIRNQGLRYLFTSRLNACWQTDWAIEDQAKNLNSTARPYDQQAFSPLDLTANWLSHLALAIYIFVVVNFDALAQASDIRIERRQVVFLCWRQDYPNLTRNDPHMNPDWLYCVFGNIVGARQLPDSMKILYFCRFRIGLAGVTGV